MLLKCPECELQVSDKAVSCPHCGYPMQPDIKPRKPRNKNNKRRRLPNGFGQISEIKNRNLRKPFRALVTVGKSETGRPICKPLKPESYFPTYNDAYAALVEYNRNPYDLDLLMSVKELYEKWTDEYFKTVGESAKRGTKNAWLYCTTVYNIKVKDLRARHIKKCIEDGKATIKGKEKTANAYVKNYIKVFFNQMLDYALEYELVDRNYSRTFNLSNDTIKEIITVKKEHLAFSESEMELLWKHIDDVQLVDVVLIQCYSGWRPQELGLIKLANIDLDQGSFIGGMKTDSGIDRIVPIHSRIKPIVERRYNEALSLGSDYLINYVSDAHHTETMLTYRRYSRAFEKIRDELELNPEHRPHDGRKSFVTFAKKHEVDEYAIKYMVGHKISDITEKIYTEREFTWLKNELEKIK